MKGGTPLNTANQPKINNQIKHRQTRQNLGQSEWIVCSDCGKKLGLISHDCSITNQKESKDE